MIDPDLIDIYQSRGSECIWNGTAAKDMSHNELLAFIGMLDELIEVERDGKGPTRG